MFSLIIGLVFCVDGLYTADGQFVPPNQVRAYLEKMGGSYPTCNPEVEKQYFRNEVTRLTEEMKKPHTVEEKEALQKRLNNFQKKVAATAVQ